MPSNAAIRAEAITAALDHWRCPIPAGLEAGYYEAQRRDSRRMQATLIIGGWALYLLFYFIDSQLYPEIAQMSLHLRLLVGLPALPIVVWALMNVKNPLAVDALLLTAVLGAAGVSLYPLWQIKGEVSSGYLATTLNFVIVICMIVCIHFWWAVLACAILGLTMIITLHHALGNWHSALLEFLGVYVLVYLFCLHLCFMRLTQARRMYLRSVFKDLQLHSLQGINQQLNQQAETDALTGIANRRAFDRALAACLSVDAATGQRRPFALLGLDIDYFKNYNDHYGHQSGDVCLQKVAKTLAQGMRVRNTAVYRVGGEEFAILAQDVADVRTLQKLAERVVEAIAAQRLEHIARPDKLGYVTISLGACLVAPQDGERDDPDFLSPRTVYEAADAQLYKAKRSGRNRAIVAALALHASAAPSQDSSAAATTEAPPADPAAPATAPIPNAAAANATPTLGFHFASRSGTH